MNKNEYLNLQNEISLKMAELRNESKRLDKEYLDSNLKLSIGDKVEVYYPERKHYNEVIPAYTEIGYVSGKEVTYSGQASYSLNKCKKDGSQSRHNLYGTFNDSNTKLIEQ